MKFKKFLEEYFVGVFFVMTYVFEEK